MLAGFASGAVAVQSVHAQRSGPGAYAIIDITEVSSPQGLNEALAKLPASVAAFGGKFVTRTENILGLDGRRRCASSSSPSTTWRRRRAEQPARPDCHQSGAHAGDESSSFVVGAEGAQWGDPQPGLLLQSAAGAQHPGCRKRSSGLRTAPHLPAP
jgi:hypothetical protein